MSPNREQPLAILAAQPSQNASAGRIQPLVFTPSFGGITIPVTSGVQSFLGSKAPSQAGGSAGDPLADPQPWDISIQPQSNNGQVGVPAVAAVYWQLRWWVKGAAFTSPIRLLDCGTSESRNLFLFNSANNRQRVVASSVEVTFWAVTNQPANTVAPLQVSVAIAPCRDASPAERLNLQWSASVAAISGNIVDRVLNPFLQGGSVAKFQCTLKTAGAGVVYPMLIDATDVSLIAGTSPIPGTVLAGLTTAGQQASFGDDVRPGTVDFNQGLVFALSTTPDVFTAPAAGPIAYAVAQVGT